MSQKTAADGEGMFAVSADGSNGMLEKLFLIGLTRQESAGKVKQSLLSVPKVENASASDVNILKTLDAEMERFGLGKLSSLGK